MWLHYFFYPAIKGREITKWISYENIIFFPMILLSNLNPFLLYILIPLEGMMEGKLWFLIVPLMAQLKMHVFQPQQQSSLSLLAFFDFGLTERKLKLKGHRFWHSRGDSQHMTQLSVQWVNKKAVRDSFVGDNSQLLLVFSNVEKRSLFIISWPKDRQT